MSGVGQEPGDEGPRRYGLRPVLRDLDASEAEREHEIEEIDMNLPLQPVVVAVSEKQPVAVRYAVAEALRLGLSLRVVHCYSLPASTAEIYPDEELVQALRDAGQIVLDDARSIVEEGDAPETEYLLSSGGPVAVLLEESHEARVLIVGADDVPWFDRMLGGEVANYVARKAHCPVVVVPESIFPYQPTGSVVVTIDGDTSAAGPLRFGFEQADGRSEGLNVLHAAPAGTTLEDFEGHQANVAEIVAGWQERFPGVRVQRTSSSGDPIETCIAATAGSSLVVIGRPHGHTMPFGLARPVAMQVVRQAVCPVAVVPVDY